MSSKRWQDIALSSDVDSPLWETFHENSKLSRYHSGISEAEVRERVAALHDSFPFDGFSTVPLPKRLPPLTMPIGEAIRSRVSVRAMTARPITLDALASLLHFGYGRIGSSGPPGLMRPRRMVPSAGALYPLELFIHAANIEGLNAGLYHYNPARHALALLRKENQIETISGSLVQAVFPLAAPALIFITAVFERSVFKYGDRGYRFILLESGHVAQNINLVSCALGLGALNIGGFFEREIDDFLQLDGITQSTLYILAVGRPQRHRPGRGVKQKRSTNTWPQQ